MDLLIYCVVHWFHISYIYNILTDFPLLASRLQSRMFLETNLLQPMSPARYHWISLVQRGLKHKKNNQKAFNNKKRMTFWGLVYRWPSETRPVCVQRVTGTVLVNRGRWLTFPKATFLSWSSRWWCDIYSNNITTSPTISLTVHVITDNSVMLYITRTKIMSDLLLLWLGTEHCLWDLFNMFFNVCRVPQ